MNQDPETVLDKIIKWAACFITLAGALCTSQGITPENIYLLNLGAGLYLIWSLRIREWNLIIINAVLLLIYVWGTLKNLLAL